jgi:hypothetical protein
MENQLEIEVLKSKEVYWSSTNQYELKIGENEYCVRVAENSNGVEYLILDLDSGDWADLEEGSHGEHGDLIVEALNDNALD